MDDQNLPVANPAQQVDVMRALQMTYREVDSKAPLQALDPEYPFSESRDLIDHPASRAYGKIDHRIAAVEEVPVAKVEAGLMHVEIARELDAMVEHHALRAAHAEIWDQHQD